MARVIRKPAVGRSHMTNQLLASRLLATSHLDLPVGNYPGASISESISGASLDEGVQEVILARELLGLLDAYYMSNGYG